MTQRVEKREGARRLCISTSRPRSAASSVDVAAYKVVIEVRCSVVAIANGPAVIGSVGLAKASGVEVVGDVCGCEVGEENALVHHDAEVDGLH